MKMVMENSSFIKLTSREGAFSLRNEILIARFLWIALSRICCLGIAKLWETLTYFPRLLMEQQFTWNPSNVSSKFDNAGCLRI